MSGCRYRAVPSRLLAAAVVAAGLCGPASDAAAASSLAFRPLPALPPIPAEIDNANERAMMQAELDRLGTRAHDLAVRREIYDRDCTASAINAAGRRDCQFRLVDLRRDSSRLHADMNAAEAWFRRVAEEAARRRLGDSALRHPAGVPAAEAADRRRDYVQDALAAGSWAKAIARLRTEAAVRRGDAALRDALVYVEAMANGSIAADVLGDMYYRHGVRRFVAGDDWSAALAFARAARDNPDDRRVFDSYALAARRQHAAPACAASDRCVGGDVAGWANRFGPRQAGAAKALLAAARAKGAAEGHRRAALRLRAAAIYAEKDALPTKLPESALAAARAAEAHARASAWTEAAVAWLAAWRATDPERAARFLELYDGAAPPASGEAAFAKLRAAFGGGAPGDPFVAALSQSQIILLQR